MKTPYRSDNQFSKRQEYEIVRGELMVEQSSFRFSWKELADYILPQRARFSILDRNRGDRRNLKILDSTATFAAHTLQSGLHAGVTSPARPWMRLLTPDPDLAEHGPVKAWLHTVTDRMLTVFKRSNIYNVLPTIYGDMGVFGTSAAAIMENPLSLLRAKSYPVGSYALGMNDDQQVDTFVREYTMTVAAVVREFGLDRQTNMIDWTNLSQTVKNLWDRGNYQQVVEVCWIVSPNLDADPTKMESKFLPFYSCYFEKGSGNETIFLRERGFHEFPIVAPRWDVTAEDTYGTDCPGMTARGDIKGLQLMERRKAQAVEKGINPSLQAPTSLRQKGVSDMPGDVNYVESRDIQHGIRATHQVQMNIADITASIVDKRYLVNQAFFVNLFLMISSMDDAQPRTATEINERHEEKLLALGPVLERTGDELLKPLIDRTYGMMLRAGMIPRPPQELNGVALKVEFTSLLADAQKLVNVAGQDRLFTSLLPLINVWPEMKFKIAPFQVVNDYSEMLGVNPNLIVPDDAATQAMQAQQQAAQSAQQTAQAQQASQTAKNLGDTDMSGDSALRRLVTAQ